MITIEEKDSDTIQLNLQGDVTADDYKNIRPALENIFKKTGPKKFLFNMKSDVKFTLGAMIQDIKFDPQHFKFIGTTAVVSTKGMAGIVTKMADVFYPVKMEQFEDVPSAYHWLKKHQVGTPGNPA